MLQNLTKKLGRLNSPKWIEKASFSMMNEYPLEVPYEAIKNSSEPIWMGFGLVTLARTMDSFWAASSIKSSL